MENIKLLNFEKKLEFFELQISNKNIASLAIRIFSEIYIFRNREGRRIFYNAKNEKKKIKRQCFQPFCIFLFKSLFMFITNK